MNYDLIHYFSLAWSWEPELKLQYTGSSSGSGFSQKFRLLAAPAPQHCLQAILLSVFCHHSFQHSTGLLLTTGIIPSCPLITISHPPVQNSASNCPRFQRPDFKNLPPYTVQYYYVFLYNIGTVFFLSSIRGSGLQYSTAPLFHIMPSSNPIFSNSVNSTIRHPSSCPKICCSFFAICFCTRTGFT